MLCKAKGCAECGQFYAQHYCSASGRWGYMEPQRWQTFLQWLHDSGLLTTAAPSRNPVRSPRLHPCSLVIHPHIYCWHEKAIGITMAALKGLLYQCLLMRCLQ